jgi:tetratricopeptide (TPR) repeat protein
MGSGQIRPLWLVALLLALPLLLSQCAKKQTLVHGVSTEEAANLQSAYSYDYGKQMPRPDAVTLPPDRLEALGEIALQSRDYQNSLFNFMQILKDQPQRHDLRYKVGVILLLTGKTEAAKRELAMVLVAQPDNMKAHEAMGLVHLEEKHYPLAIDEFQIALSQNPTQAKTRYLLGVAFLEAGQPEKAVNELKKAAALDSRQVYALVALGQAYLKMKKYQEAVTYLKQGQALVPGDQKVNYHLGMALAAQKRYPEALEAFLKVGDEAQAYNNIGVYYFQDGRYEEAAKCFQKAIDLRPTFYQEARANLQRALEKLHESRKNDG